jgi:hypothetical protein
LCIFDFIIATIAIGINIIRQSHSNGKVTRIMTGKITEAVFSKHNRINGHGITQVDFYPAISAIADPTRPTTIETVVDV